jgi:hypothetical protein
MSNSGMAPDHHGHVLVQNPPLARFLFQSTIAFWGWLILRVWVGLQFLQAGWAKFNEPAWMDGSGSGILGFWTNAPGTTASGAPIVTYDWYRNFLQIVVDSHAEGCFRKSLLLGSSRSAWASSWVASSDWRQPVGSCSIPRSGWRARPVPIRCWQFSASC